MSKKGQTTVPKKDHITMRINEDVHVYLKSMADREGRNLSNMIHRLLSAAVQSDKISQGKVRIR